MGWLPVLPPQDQPYFRPDEDVFRLFDPADALIAAWRPVEHIPCWLDFIPNRDTRISYVLQRGGERWPLPAGALRQVIGQTIRKMQP